MDLQLLEVVVDIVLVAMAMEGSRLAGVVVEGIYTEWAKRDDVRCSILVLLRWWGHNSL